VAGVVPSVEAAVGVVAGMVVRLIVQLQLKQKKFILRKSLKIIQM